MKQNNRIDNIFQKISRKIIDYCILGGFVRIVIGYNKGWKDEINIGKKNNQGIELSKKIVELTRI